MVAKRLDDDDDDEATQVSQRLLATDELDFDADFDGVSAVKTDK